MLWMVAGGQVSVELEAYTRSGLFLVCLGW